MALRSRTAIFLGLVVAGSLLALAGCERVGASSRPPAQISPAVQQASPESGYEPSAVLGSTTSSAEDSGAAALLDGTANEPTDAADALPAATPDDPSSFPTVSSPPTWGTRFGGIIDGISTHERVVALTFDDGPTAHTRKIVGELESAGAHATFFWVGSRITTDAARFAVAHGEEIANHTWTHPNMRRLTSEEASEQIGLTTARIVEVTGYTPIWFRSPYNRLYNAELAQLGAHGLLYANYNVTSIDWMKGVTKADVLGKIGDNLRPGGVILMHDSPHHDPTVLPEVLRLLKRRGYQIVTMTQLAQMGPAVRDPLRLGVQGLGY